MRQLFLVGWLLLASVVVRSQALDGGFSGDGKATVAFGTLCVGNAVAVQPADQKIVIAGAYETTTPAFFSFCVTRLLTNGTFDSSFGVLGKTMVPFSQNTSGATAMALAPDGKIVLTGSLYTNLGVATACVIRLTKDGRIDSSFGNAGVLSLSVPTTGKAVVVQPDGNILVAGEHFGNGFNYQYSVVRLLGTNGSVDPNFGTGGTVSTAVDGANGGLVSAMVLQKNGQVLVTGTGKDREHAITVRYSHLGVLDNNFGSQGISSVTVDGDDLLDANGIALDTIGNILIAGDYYPSGGTVHDRFLVIRLTFNGALDPSFAGNGKLGVPFPNSDSYATSVGVEHDGNIIVSGYTKSQAFALCRITGNGALDLPWGTGGEVVTTWSGIASRINGMAFQLNGSIVCAGVSGADIGVARYLYPITLPRPPVILSTNTSAFSAGAGTLNFAGVRIFPNPASSELQVQGLDPAMATLLAVKDASGRAMMTVKALGQSTYPLDIHRLPSGSYFLELSTTGDHRSFQFIKTP